MRPAPVIRAARGGLSGRRVQAIVIGLVVGVSTAASTLALGTLVESSAPYDHTFSAQHGADVTATVTGASPAQLAATTREPGVTASAGPFPETTVSATAALVPFTGQTPVTVQTQLTLAGRSSPGGPVDDLTLKAGHWATGQGQVVRASSGSGPQLGIGSLVTVTGVPGSPKLTVVGVATSATGTADGWVTPSEIAALHASGAPEWSQMLYRFSSAGTTAAVNTDIAAVEHGLPHGSVLGTESWLTAKARATSSFAPWVPFIVAFGLIGLVMSVLIVVNVVSGAVAAGIRRIGVLKSLGFSPPQVVAAYALQVGIPAIAGCLAGAVGGYLLAGPVLGQTAQVYGVGSLAMPVWVSVAVPLAILGLTGGTAVAIALRAGRMSAIQAIATGRAPRPRRGYGAHRLLGRAHLPRPVSIGLAGPFARPARTLVTLAAIVFGVTAVTFGYGLSASLSQVEADLSHSASDQVRVLLAGRQNGLISINGQNPAKLSLVAQERAVTSALRAEPGTAHYVAEADDQVSVLGLAGQLQLTGYEGNASWTGYAMISGHRYSAPGQVDVNTAFLNDSGTKVGQEYTLTSGAKHATVQIAGEVFDPAGGRPVMMGSTSTLAAVDPGLSAHMYQAGLAPGTDVGSYIGALQSALGPGYAVSVNDSGGGEIADMQGLVAMLTLLIVVVAGSGVLNTVVLQTRERVHDLGVFKAVGMTPRQTITMVVSMVAGIGLVAGLAAVPAGVALHQYVLPIMGNAVQSALPAAVLDVYHAPELILLALAGLVIAVAGALIPASWAAKTRTATALRTE